MRALVSIAALGLLALPVAAHAQAPAQPLPEWAYPVAPAPKPPDATKPIALPGSTKQYTQAQIDNRFGPPDWYPEDHGPMPEVVATGRAPNGFACALCHLTSGGGHPESAGISGLPVAYFLRQMEEFKAGTRKGMRGGIMIQISKAISDEDTKAAAQYFGGMKHPIWYKVVESDTVPKSYLGNGAMRFPVENGGTEPLGNRIIELPQNDLSAESRDPRTGFVAHVPVGSVKKGEELVTTGGGKTTACAVCHGAELKGLGQVPAITGRSPMYIYRQLNDIKIGTRNGEWVPLMKGVVDKLSDADMIAISAYLTSKPPT
jgi:cytochrome c553